MLLVCVLIFVLTTNSRMLIWMILTHDISPKKKIELNIV